MDFNHDEATEAFRVELRAFARAHLAPHYQQDDRAETFHAGLRESLAALGIFGLLVPEEFGGQGADCVTSGVACEELAYADFNAAWLVTNSLLVSAILAQSASTEQQHRWLPLIAGGEVVPAICLTEPQHGSDAASLELRAAKDGRGWRLVGEKASVSLGMHAEMALVFARTGGPGADGISGFYVDLDPAFVSRAAYADLGGRAIGRASLHFDGLPVGPEALVGAEGSGFRQVMQGFDYSRALIALLCIGCAQASLDEAFEYARQREAFGQAIGRFQGVAFPLVEQATYLKAARLLSYEALWRKDQGLEHTVESNMVKWWAPKASLEAAHQALLTFGQLGYSEEFPLGQRLRDIIGMEIGDGTAQIAKLVVARQILGRESAP